MPIIDIIVAVVTINVGSEINIADFLSQSMFEVGKRYNYVRTSQ